MQTLDNRSRRFTALLMRVIGFSLAFTFAGLVLADPPTRVARLGYFTGAVSFSPAGETEWVAGTLNRPLVSGDRLWSDDGGRIELQIGSSVVRLGSRTLFTLTNLDDRIAQMHLQDGTLNLRVRRLERNQVVEVDTPNLAFVIRQAGEYRVTVDAARNSTEVRTRSGRAEVYGKGASYTVGLGRAYRFFGAGLVDYDVLTLPRADEFDRWCQTRDRRYDTSTSARYVSRDVIGYQDLDQYGSWRSIPEYGNVWTPSRVSAGWAPYRDGHWSWVEPWGWTWIDDLPWGFAVSHYGRWINSDGRWGWIPGPTTARAVYAPALVAFIGGNNFPLSSSGRNGGAVGWFPLGPREVYRPAYAVSREYFTNVNISNTVINNTTIINYYDNRNSTTMVANAVYVNQSVPGAVVAVPTTTFVQAQPVARAAMRVSEAALAGAAVTTLAAIAPVQTSVLGAAPARARPPQVADQRFVAQSQPPAAPVAFAVRERALAVNPGKPVEAAVLATLKPAAPVVRGATGTPGTPGAVITPPRVEIVPDARAAGPAVVAPPPRAPSDRGGNREQVLPQAAPPSAQPQPGPLPALPSAAARPVAPAAQEAQRPGNRPSEAPGRPVTAPPLQPGSAIAPPPPTPTSPGNKPREQREAPPVSAVPPAPARVLPPAQAQPAPSVLPVPPGARAPSPLIQEAARPGTKPSEAAGRPVTAPPVQPGSATTSPPPQPPATPAGRGNKPREQRDAPAVAQSEREASVAPAATPPPARPPQQNAAPVAQQVERGRGQPQRVRPEPAPTAQPQPAPSAPPVPAAAARPAEPATAGNPPKPAKGDKKPPVTEDKKGDKKDDKDDEDVNPQPDVKEKKRK